MSIGFAKNLIPAILCPKDRAHLAVSKLAEANAKVIFSGELICSSCGQSYLIKSGILHLLSAQGRINELMSQEMQARDQQTAVYDQRLANRYEKEVPSTLKILGDINNKKIIEYACGTGRLTNIIATNALLVLATDFSLDSLLLLGKKLEDHSRDNIGLVWADAVHLQTSEHFFDIALAAQFYEHIISLDLRKNFLRNVKNTLVLNGSLIMSLYHQDLRRRQRALPQEGKHNSGIFFHYFLAKELSQELVDNFVVKNLRHIDIHLPGERHLRLSAKVAGKLSRLVENIPVLKQFGHLLLVKATRKI